MERLMEIFNNVDKQYSKHMIHYFYRDFDMDSGEKQNILPIINQKSPLSQDEKNDKRTV